MKKILYVLLLIAVVFAACKDNQENTTPSNPVISSITPSTAMANEVVTIRGKRFSKTISDNIVKFLGVNAEVLNATDTLLTVVVPSEGSTGNITITVGNRTSKGPLFTYEIAGLEEEKEEYFTSTYAGTGVAGGDVGPISIDLAKFSTPNGVTIDPTTGDLIVTNRGTHSISRVTKAGIVTRIAGGTSGNVDGAISAARFNNPYKSVVDKFGNIYVADNGNNKIRKIDLTTNTVSTLAGAGGTGGFVDGQGAVAKFDAPTGIAVDDDLNVYVADAANHAIRKISPTGKVVTLVGNNKEAGIVDGTWPNARVNRPTSVCMGKDGFLYTADRYGQRIRKINVNTGEIVTIAGTGGSTNTTGAILDGEVMKARFNNPWGIDIDKHGTIYVSELGYSTTNAAHVVRMIKNGKVTTIAGITGVTGYADGLFGVSMFNNPSDIAVDDDGIIYVGDQSNHRVRKIVKVPKNP